MKSENRTADNAMIREINRKQVFACVNQYGPIPRVEICKRIGLSKPTVTRVIEQLISEELLIETNTIESTRGRHPVNVDVQPTSRYCIGLNLSKNTLGAALVDLKMNIVEKRLTSLKDVSSTQMLLTIISDVIIELLESSKVETRKILGVGIGVPGLVDYNTGIVRDFALSGEFRDIPLVKYLEERFAFPVAIDNNCNTRILGEYYYGYATECSNAVFILNSEGVGCGLLMNGQVNRRLNNIASGFGHLCVDFHGPSCHCGGQGCIEAFCSTEVIERKAYQRLCAQNKSNQDALIEIPSFQAVCASVENGDMTYSNILMEAAQAMSSGIVSMINLFDPEVIILSGNMFDASDYYYKSVVQEINIRIGNGSSLPRIMLRRVKDALYEIGAAAMIFQKIM